MSMKLVTNTYFIVVIIVIVGSSDNSSSTSSLVGRNLITLRDYTNDEVKQLLWTAMDLKKTMKGSQQVSC